MQPKALKAPEITYHEQPHGDEWVHPTQLEFSPSCGVRARGDCFLSCVSHLSKLEVNGLLHLSTQANVTYLALNSTRAVFMLRMSLGVQF